MATLQRFTAKLAEPVGYLGYQLNRCPEVYNPNFIAARELGHVLRGVYTLLFALLDAELECVASSLRMPYVLLENRILRLGFSNEELEGLFVHAHLNYVNLRNLDWDLGDESILEHVCTTLIRQSTKSLDLLKSQTQLTQMDLSLKTIEYVLETVEPILEPADSSSYVDEEREDSGLDLSDYEEREDRGLDLSDDEEREDRGLDLSDDEEREDVPPWVNTISALQYLKHTPECQALVRERLGKMHQIQKEMNTCTDLRYALTKIGPDLDEVRRLLAIKFE